MIPKKPKKQIDRQALQAEQAQQALSASEFMVLGETEGQCQVNSNLADKRKHCRRTDTVMPCVYLADGTRDGSLVAVGRVCMKHLPSVIALVKTELPGGNGDEFKRHLRGDIDASA